MEIHLRRIDDAYLMESVNENGNIVHTDGSSEIGGGNQAFRPMQLMLAGLGSCSAIDIIHLLRKQRQPLEDIRIKVEGEREKDKVPSLFTDIHIHYTLVGDLDIKNVERAITLSMDKLCSVAQILKKTANITWSYEIVRE